MFSGSFGVRSIVLCKCSGKYIDIYFILKITFFMRGENWLHAGLHYLSRVYVHTARYCLQFAGASLRARLSRLHGQFLYVCGPGGGTV